MKTLMSVIAFSLSLLLLTLVFGKEKPTKSAMPLGADEIAIYQSILQQYTSDHSALMNVSDKTFPLDPLSPTLGLDNRDCLSGIKLDLSILSHTFHELTQEILPAKNTRFVDQEKQAKIVHRNDPGRTIRKGKSVQEVVGSAFGTGLFSMSEIAFDKGRSYAVVATSFYCGSLCGHGTTLIFEKIGDNWKKTNRSCGGWIS
jgi:hypothetical protein